MWFGRVRKLRESFAAALYLVSRRNEVGSTLVEDLLESPEAIPWGP
jgi:hypothetical protein